MPPLNVIRKNNPRKSLKLPQKATVTNLYVTIKYVLKPNWQLYDKLLIQIEN